jgi:hypothetical protein
MTSPLDNPARSTSSTAVSDCTRAYRGRRLSWQEFYAQRPDLKPANDNLEVGTGATSILGAVAAPNGAPSLRKR